MDSSADGSRSEIPADVPPFWTGYDRTNSDNGQGVECIRKGSVGPIVLEDRTLEPSTSGALSVKNVTVDDYTTVHGNAGGIGDYVSWNCSVHTSDVKLSE